MRTRKEGIVLAIFFAALFLSTMAWAVDCPIPDTGQTKCYDDTQEIPCPSPGQDFYGQDAQYPCNPQSYTMLSGGIMVRDNVTGLIWEVKTIANMNDTYTWQDAQDVFIATLNNDNFGGYSDWRLPTIKELSFIRNMDTYNPAFDTTYFPNTVVKSAYWSSTSFVSDPSFAWGVYFGSGHVFRHRKSINRYVRAVRGGQCGSFGDFVDNGNGTVTDTSTGLMWEVKTDDGGSRDKDNYYTWEEALSYCENLTLAGYNDWRLPSFNELQLLVDYRTVSPTINTTYFPNTVSEYYKSSTSDVGTPVRAWAVYFGNGILSSSMKYTIGGYVRAVRGRQCGSFDPSTTTTIDSTTSTISGSTTTTVPGSTTTTTCTGPCCTELIYGEYSEEIELIRFLRDDVLSQTREGQQIIRLYYQWSPVIVKAMQEDEEFKEEVKELIDGVLGLVGGSGE